MVCCHSFLFATKRRKKPKRRRPPGDRRTSKVPLQEGWLNDRLFSMMRGMDLYGLLPLTGFATQWRILVFLSNKQASIVGIGRNST
jgi:hypothetical protein